jgi:hypothetical protein
MPQDPFLSSKYSIKHAQRRLAELELEIIAFNKSSPYTRFTELNEDGTQETHIVKLTTPLPESLSGIVFDAINSLRAALDQAGRTVAIASGSRGKRAKFPFGATETEARSRRANSKSQSIQVPAKIFDLMMAFKPYKGGDDLLWILNEICNSHKHEMIIPIGMGQGGSAVTVNYLKFFGPLNIPPVWDRTKNQMELFRTEPGCENDYNFRLEIFVAFANVPIIDGESAHGVLSAMISKVNSIIMAIEAEARRMRLIN